MIKLDEQSNCALCGMLLPRGRPYPIALTIGREGEKVLVCEDSSTCRRRAIEIMRALERMKEKL